MAKSIEDYRRGYPQYTRLLSLHPAFQNFRRFTRTRMRLLLLKQDEISSLEERLDLIDAGEVHDLFLGCSRLDSNAERQQTLDKLRVALAEYDAMLEECRRTLSLQSANARDIGSLRNWLFGTTCIARQESAYLTVSEDLLNLTGSADSAITLTECTVGRCLVWVHEHVTKYLPLKFNSRNPNLTSDEHIFIFGPRLRRVSRILTTWLAACFLLLPVIILFIISSPVGRLLTVVASAAGFLSAVSALTEARTIEIFAAGASYMAVLVVFMSTSESLHSRGTC
ncbi:hypothetical protein EV356DRAFT_569100 [Viridothelium virens]|uniref:DUF6594 domain-containing protein n=1 Tax=Viridothelium virens TaxID=1048519 RepID=A0A6A6H385_VIRVR|nr:hypothetical protein EV356DRAFT_569100 [Viridothelium virens]